MVNYANKQHTFGELRLVLAPLAHVLVAENVHHFADNILSRAQIVSLFPRNAMTTTPNSPE